MRTVLWVATGDRVEDVKAEMADTFGAAFTGIWERGFAGSYKATFEGLTAEQVAVKIPGACVWTEQPGECRCRGVRADCAACQGTAVTPAPIGGFALGARRYRARDREGLGHIHRRLGRVLRHAPILAVRRSFGNRRRAGDAEEPSGIFVGRPGQRVDGLGA